MEEMQCDIELMHKIHETYRQWMEGLLLSQESINIIVALIVENATEKEEEENGKN